MSLVDQAYTDILAGLDQEPVPPREVGIDPVPRFDFYHLRFTEAAVGQTATHLPFIRPTAQVLAGPQGSVGRFVSDDIYLSVKDTIKEFDESGESTERPKTAEEMDKGIARLRNTLLRISAALKIPVLKSTDDSAVQAFANGFVGREAIACVRVEKARGNFAARNRIVWMSLAAPSDPPKNANGGLTSALDEALQRIERFNSKQRGKTLGRTLGGTRPKAGTLQ